MAIENTFPTVPIQKLIKSIAKRSLTSGNISFETSRKLSRNATITTPIKDIMRDKKALAKKTEEKY